jgi:hypothetical protein
MFMGGESNDAITWLNWYKFVKMRTNCKEIVFR